MEGSYSLLRRVDLEQYGQSIHGLEVIGNLRPFGEEPSDDVKSRFYDSRGHTLDYTYELDGNTLTISEGARGSPAYFQGTFDETGDVFTGAWVSPGGGGYDSEMTRVL